MRGDAGKLTKEQIDRMIRDYLALPRSKSGKISYGQGGAEELARRFGIPRSTMQDIVRRELKKRGN